MSVPAETATPTARKCELCESDEKHTDEDRVVFVDGKPFCMNGRWRLVSDGELNEEGDFDLTDEERDALLAETVEPIKEYLGGLPEHPWNGDEWRILNPAPKPAHPIVIRSDLD